MCKGLGRPAPVVGATKWQQRWLEKRAAGRGPRAVNAPLSCRRALGSKTMLPAARRPLSSRCRAPRHAPVPTQPSPSLPPSRPPLAPSLLPTVGFSHQSEQHISCGKSGGFTLVAASFPGEQWARPFVFSELALGGWMEGQVEAMAVVGRRAGGDRLGILLRDGERGHICLGGRAGRTQLWTRGEEKGPAGGCLAGPPLDTWSRP